MTIPMLTRQYAVCVYIYGTRAFSTVHVDYREAVKRYAAGNYSQTQIDEALAKGYITEQEYVETIAYTQVVE